MVGKELATEADNLSLIAGTHMEEERFLLVAFRLPNVYTLSLSIPPTL